MGGFPVTTDPLIRDYLGRLEASAAALPAHRRAELAREVSDHIDAALAEAGRSDEITVLNILERLGSPEEIVADEAGPGGASPVAGSGSRWGTMELIAGALLVLAWPALLLRFEVLGIYLGYVLWLAFGALGLVLAWASGVWSTRQKQITTVVVVALYALVIVVTTPTRVVVTPAGSPIEPTVTTTQ